MSTISVQEIQHDPLGFLLRVEAGEAFCVVRDHRPLAEVIPIPATNAELRPYGLGAGQYTLPDDFDQPLPEDILQDYEFGHSLPLLPTV